MASPTKLSPSTVTKSAAPGPNMKHAGAHSSAYNEPWQQCERNQLHASCETPESLAVYRSSEERGCLCERLRFYGVQPATGPHPSRLPIACGDRMWTRRSRSTRITVAEIDADLLDERRRRLTRSPIIVDEDSLARLPKPCVSGDSQLSQRLSSRRAVSPISSSYVGRRAWLGVRISQSTRFHSIVARLSPRRERRMPASFFCRATRRMSVYARYVNAPRLASES